MVSVRKRNVETTDEDPGVQALQKQLAQLKELKSVKADIEALDTLESRRMHWVKNNSLAREHFGDLGKLHDEALSVGYADMSPAYIDHMNKRLHDLAAGHPHAERLARRLAEREPEPPPEPEPARGSLVSAPVSREVPGSGGYRSRGTTLTAEERQHARIAGISDTEYAAQKLAYIRAKEEGRYG